MVKLQNVQAYPIDGVPDHLVHECHQTGIEIAKMIQEKYGDTHPNIMLGAVSFLHASMILYHVVEKPEEIRKATRNAATALIKNIHHFSGVDALQENE